MSSVSWLAYSESERKRTLDVIQLLSEPQTRDELGIGRIRDALSNLLFPGTSTIQTRARYFLFVPWTYLSLEARSPVEDAARRARSEEVWLIQAFRRAQAEGRQDLDLDGVIGVQAGESLVQLPSYIYWGGLKTWGIRLLSGARGSYHRFLTQHQLRDVELDDDGEPVQGATLPRWDVHAPERPRDLFDEPSMALTHDEADYLYERVTTSCADSTLAELLIAAVPQTESEYPWQLSTRELDGLSPQNRQLLLHAEFFSLLLHGAALLYNRMLGEVSHRQERAEHYRNEFQSWAADVGERHSELVSWHEDLEGFWETAKHFNPRLPGPRERHFVEKWIDWSLDDDPGRLLTDEGARAHIADRERQLKGPNARLGNPSALEDWGGASGSGRLNFRWGVVQTLLGDIEDGRARQGTNEVDDA